MSASHRSLLRLPLSVFTDLLIDDDPSNKRSENPMELRRMICGKLNESGNSGRLFGGYHGAFSSSESVTTVGQLLTMTPPSILRALDPLLTHEECREFVRRVCAICSAPSQSALCLLRQTVTVESGGVSSHSDKISSKKCMRHVISGMESLDKCLRGGFRIGSVSEVVGRAGVGKTQLAMQLCVIAAKYGQGSVYIDAEKKLHLPRLKEIAHEQRHALHRPNDNNSPRTTTHTDSGEHGFYYKGSRNDQESTNSGSQNHTEKFTLLGTDDTNPEDVLQNITIHSPRSTSELLTVVSNIEEEILLRNDEASNVGSTKFPVRLIILDSIAAPARRDFGAETAPQRVSSLFKIAQTLKRIADQLQVAVVVINQIGMARRAAASGLQQVVSGDQSTTSTTEGSDFVAVSAALGNSWYHCVSTRLLLEHERDPHRILSDKDVAHDIVIAQSMDNIHPSEKLAWMSERGLVRTATVVKSNVADQARMSYQVTVKGLCEIA